MEVPWTFAVTREAAAQDPPPVQMIQYLTIVTIRHSVRIQTQQRLLQTSLLIRISPLRTNQNILHNTSQGPSSTTAVEPLPIAASTGTHPVGIVRLKDLLQIVLGGDTGRRDMSQWCEEK